jgi:hypothetical protein
MQITKFNFLPEYQHVNGDIIPLIVPCFFPGCKKRAIMRVTIVDDETTIIPSYCGKCAAKPVEELAEQFIGRGKWEK